MQRKARRRVFEPARPTLRQSQGGLPAQIHRPLPIHLPEERILQVLDEVDRFAGALHLRPQALVHIGELVETEDGHLDRLAIHTRPELEADQLGAEHDLGGPVRWARHLRAAEASPEALRPYLLGP